MKINVPPRHFLTHKSDLNAVMVDRRDPMAPEMPLMKSTAVLALLKAGSTINLLEATGINPLDFVNDNEPDLITPQELSIKARWKNKDEERALCDKNANVFGALGLLLVDPDLGTIKIPTMNARAVPHAFLEKYGAEIIPLNKHTTLNMPHLEHLYLVQYDFNKNYIEQYVMQPEGGGGLFVEHHPFPHFFIPLSKACTGALILGVNRGNEWFDFAAFTIPFGFALKIAPNVIHGDSFFVGPYAIALTQTEQADSVLFRQNKSSRDIQKVLLTPLI